MDLVRNWFSRHLANPQIVSLGVVLVLALVTITWFGAILGPLFAAIVFAYLLEGPVTLLQRFRCSRLLSTILVWTVFSAITMILVFAVVPLVTRQAGQVVQEIPFLIANAREFLQTLPERYPQVFTAAQVDEVVMTMTKSVGEFRNAVFARSWVVGVGILYVGIYLVLVPLLVFFLLKDKGRIVAWGGKFMPTEIGLIRSVWKDVDRQLANYVRGKFIEIAIVGLFSYAIFTWRDLNYAALLAALVGVSVLIPYLGALVVTLPVMMVAYAQWGFGAELGWIFFLYGMIQGLDGNVLVPLLFSEAVDLHPVAIITAVLFFGGIWGFWGVFFAIPLATVVNAILVAWPEDRLLTNDPTQMQPDESAPHAPG
ncbi:MAG: AI-2E family transporter [Oceanococcus sp.]